MRSKVAIAFVILAIVAVAMYMIVSESGKPSEILISGGNIQIKGSFGTIVPLAEITGLDLKAGMPAIGTKTNGMGLGSRYQGQFTLKDGTKARLFLDATKPPFVSFMHGDTVFYMNQDSVEKTQALYDQLKAELAGTRP